MQMKRNRKRRTLSTTKKKRKTQRNIRLGFLILGIVLVVMLIIKINNPGFFSNKYYEVDTKAVDASKPDIDVELLTPKSIFQIAGEDRQDYRDCYSLYS